MSTFTAEVQGHRLLDTLLRADQGLPIVVITDRDPKFISDLQRAVFNRIGTKLLRSTAYYPQTDGQLERTNQIVEIALRYQIVRYLDRAIEQKYTLPQLQFVLNNSENASTGVAPNILLYSFKLREALDCKLGGLLADREVLRGEAEDAIAFANVVIKKRYNSKYKAQEPKPGNVVILNLKNYYIPRVTNRKLSDRRIGPFAIKDIYSRLVYRLALPKHQKIYPIISITDLELLLESDDLYVARRTRAARKIQLLNQANTTIEPETLLDRRIQYVGRNRKEFTEYLVRQIGRDSSYDTQVREENLPILLVRRYRLQYVSSITLVVYLSIVRRPYILVQYRNLTSKLKSFSQYAIYIIQKPYFQTKNVLLVGRATLLQIAKRVLKTVSFTYASSFVY